ncbi:hypothetical protein FS837_010962 [Tulasnella sp. UAMH 9824]|nr:hypothetical protein FS837_010962 [Tulasnella sp. UAMH 9824]
MEDINYLRSMHSAVESPDQAFCPKLRELEVRFDDLQPYEYDFLAGGLLRNFKLIWTPPNRNGLVEVFQGAMRGLALRSPMIEHITAFRSDSAFTDYGEFHKLRTLDHGGDFSVGSWLQLCEGCPLLEEVHIWWIQKDSELPDQSLIASAPGIRELAALRVLSIATIANGMFTDYILQTTNMPQLTGLEVNLVPLTSVEGDRLLALVRRRSPSLTTLKVHAHTLEWVSFALFGNLHDLELYGTLGSWTEEHLERIFGNLPNLTRLVIAASTEDGVDRTRPAFTPVILEMIATRCRLDQLEIPLNALGVPWASEPQTPTAKFDGLTVLALDPLHIDPNAKEQFAKYLAQLCPTVEDFETMPLHPRAIWSDTEPPWELTEEERKNMQVMENLFFDAQGEYIRSLG